MSILPEKPAQITVADQLIHGKATIWGPHDWENKATEISGCCSKYEYPKCFAERSCLKTELQMGKPYGPDTSWI